MTFAQNAIIRDFSRAANAYEREASLQLRILKQLATSIPADALVLDAGCATGALATLIPNPMIGIDIASAMCTIAQTRMPCAVASVEALPIKNESIDAIVCASVLQWVNDPAKAFAEFYRTLKPGGTLLISIFGPQTLNELLAIARDRVSEFATLEQWKAKAQTAGFSVKHTEQTLYQERFASSHALLQHLKTIGATNKRTDRPKHLTTPRALAALEQAYPVRKSDGISATFEVIVLELRK